MPEVGATNGTVKTVVLGDETQNSFDNITFLDSHTLIAGEDRGDTLHDQENVLDSIWSYDLNKTYSEINGDAQRLVALGRDPEASGVGAEDNEPTGIYVSDGGTAAGDLLGAYDPSASSRTRIFFTEQHGANNTYEIVPPAVTQPTGAQGPQGEQGQQGQDGKQGADGKQGQDGAAGKTGPAGPQGQPGQPGSKSSVTVKLVFGKVGGNARIQTSTSSAGVVSAKVTAKKGGKSLVLAAGSGTAGSSGVARVSLRERPGAVRGLRGTTVPATLEVKFAPTGGGSTATATRKIKYEVGG
ncbi:MAG: hypothetical protein JST08_16750 [Actinobacteria bacterium]|nr:hypothetical protein [Actinomycetota bacterium]